MRPLRIYISGPYTADPETCTRDAIDVGNILLDLGYAPFVPHLSHFWNEATPRTYEDWMRIDLAWIEASDAVLRLPGRSSGAEREVAAAMDADIPVFFSLTDFLENVGMVCPSQPSASIPEPVRGALDRIERTFRSKNADYADEKSSWSSNFEDVANQMGWLSPQEAAEALIAVKQARLRSMRANGRPPVNEAVEDTVLDRAVYSVIALALLMSEDADTCSY